MKWYLQSADDLHTSLELTPNEVVSLGRTLETGITDKEVSKIHTLFKFQPAKNIVLCKHIGKHPAIVNGLFWFYIRIKRFELDVKECSLYNIHRKT